MLNRLLSLAFVLACMAEGPAYAAPLRSIAAMLELSPEQLAEQPSVEVDAIALCALQHGSQFAAWQDGVGIYVNAAWGDGEKRKIIPPQRISPGDRLRIKGTVRNGDVSPVIVPTQIDWLAKGTLPEARPANLIGMLSGRLSSQWVRVKGVVQAVSVFPGQKNYWLLQVGTPHGRFAIRMKREQHIDPASWIDAEVSVRGTCLSSLNPRGEMMGVRLLTNTSTDVTVLTAPPEDPFEVPELPLGRLQTFSPHDLMPHRRKIVGTVTFCRPGSYLYLQEGERGVKVINSDPSPYQPGDRLVASGFIVPADRVLGMEHALLRKLESGPPPEALEITQISPELLRRPSHPPPYDDLNGRLVELTGTLELDGEDLEGRWISVVIGETLVQVRLPVQMPDGIPSRGSVVELTGICELRYPDAHLIANSKDPNGIRLLMRDKTDLVVIKAAPWWTPQRLWLVVAGMTALLLVSLLWVRMLNHKVRQRSLALASEIASRQEAETRTQERTRIAEDLHDTVAQGLTGVSLQLEAAGRASRERPEQLPRHLGLASQILDSSRDEIRRSLWNLRSGLLDTGDLLGSLRAIAANLSPDNRPEISCHCEGTIQALPERVAHAVLRTAQEAISNAIKHAFAQSIEAILEFKQDEVALQVRDDGKGFVLEEAKGPEATHFGLQGMRDRARRLGGGFRAESQPGHGTTIHASFPYALADEAQAPAPSDS